MKILGLISILMLVVSRAESKRKSTGVIGKNSLMCITFDQLDCNCDFIATNGVIQNTFGVRQKARCGLDGPCGLFAVPSVLKLPLFLKDFLFEFTLSVWFKRSKRLRGGLPTIYSLGDCGNAGFEIITLDDEHISWTVRDSISVTTKTAKTKSQSIGWHHSVAVIEISPVTMLGRADMYFDGKKIGQTKIDVNGLPDVNGRVHIGGNECTEDRSVYFVGLMDSVSIARYVSSAKEVRQLYRNRGQCVGE